MAISCRRTKKGAFFIMEDRVSIEDASAFHAGLKENLDRPLIIDMSRTEYIDTAIVQLILAAKEAAKKRGIGLRIISPPQPLLEAICQTGFAGEMQITCFGDKTPN